MLCRKSRASLSAIRKGMVDRLYHFHVTQVRRSAGSSVIASAAYRAGEKLYSERYGETRDYTRKAGVIFTEIVLPDNAPSAYKDRATLWNAVDVYFGVRSPLARRIRSTFTAVWSTSIKRTLRSV